MAQQLARQATSAQLPDPDSLPDAVETKFEPVFYALFVREADAGAAAALDALAAEMTGARAELTDHVVVRPDDLLNKKSSKKKKKPQDATNQPLDAAAIAALQALVATTVTERERSVLKAREAERAEIIAELKKPPPDAPDEGKGSKRSKSSKKKKPRSASRKRRSGKQQAEEDAERLAAEAAEEERRAAEAAEKRRIEHERAQRRLLYHYRERAARNKPESRLHVLLVGVVNGPEDLVALAEAGMHVGGLVTLASSPAAPATMEDEEDEAKFPVVEAILAAAAERGRALENPIRDVSRVQVTLDPPHALEGDEARRDDESVATSSRKKSSKKKKEAGGGGGGDASAELPPELMAHMLRLTSATRHDSVHRALFSEWIGDARVVHVAKAPPAVDQRHYARILGAVPVECTDVATVVYALVEQVAVADAVEDDSELASVLDEVLTLERRRPGDGEEASGVGPVVMAWGDAQAQRHALHCLRTHAQSLDPATASSAAAISSSSASSSGAATSRSSKSTAAATLLLDRVSSAPWRSRPAVARQVAKFVDMYDVPSPPEQPTMSDVERGTELTAMRSATGISHATLERASALAMFEDMLDESTVLRAKQSIESDARNDASVKRDWKLHERRHKELIRPEALRQVLLDATLGEEVVVNTRYDALRDQLLVSCLTHTPIRLKAVVPTRAHVLGNAVFDEWRRLPRDIRDERPEEVYDLSGRHSGVLESTLTTLTPHDRSIISVRRVGSVCDVLTRFYHGSSLLLSPGGGGVGDDGCRCRCRLGEHVEWSGSLDASLLVTCTTNDGLIVEIRADSSVTQRRVGGDSNNVRVVRPGAPGEHACVEGVLRDDCFVPNELELKRAEQVDPESGARVMTREDLAMHITYANGATLAQHANGTRIYVDPITHDELPHWAVPGATDTRWKLELVHVEAPGTVPVTFVRVAAAPRDFHEQPVVWAALKVEIEGTHVVRRFNGSTRIAQPFGPAVVDSGYGSALCVPDGAEMVALLSKDARDGVRVEEEAHVPRGVFYVDHAAGRLSVTDAENNTFEANAVTGKASVVLSRHKGISTGDDDADSGDLIPPEFYPLPAKTVEPRLFVVHGDGSGAYELLTDERVERALREVDEDPLATVVRSGDGGMQLVRTLTTQAVYRRTPDIPTVVRTSPHVQSVTDMLRAEPLSTFIELRVLRELSPISAATVALVREKLAAFALNHPVRESIQQKEAMYAREKRQEGKQDAEELLRIQAALEEARRRKEAQPPAEPDKAAAVPIAVVSVEKPPKFFGARAAAPPRNEASEEEEKKKEVLYSSEKGELEARLHRMRRGKTAQDNDDGRGGVRDPSASYFADGKFSHEYAVYEAAAAMEASERTLDCLSELLDQMRQIEETRDPALRFVTLDDGPMGIDAPPSVREHARELYAALGFEKEEEGEEAAAGGGEQQPQHLVLTKDDLHVAEGAAVLARYVEQLRHQLLAGYDAPSQSSPLPSPTVMALERKHKEAETRRDAHAQIKLEDRADLGDSGSMLLDTTPRHDPAYQRKERKLMQIAAQGRPVHDRFGQSFRPNYASTPRSPNRSGGGGGGSGEGKKRAADEVPALDASAVQSLNDSYMKRENDAILSMRSNTSGGADGGFLLLPAYVDVGVVQPNRTYRVTISMTNSGRQKSRFVVHQPPLLEDSAVVMRVLYRPGPVAPGIRLRLELEIFTGTGHDESLYGGRFTRTVRIDTEHDLFELPVEGWVETESFPRPGHVATPTPPSSSADNKNRRRRPKGASAFGAIGSVRDHCEGMSKGMKQLFASSAASAARASMDQRRNEEDEQQQQQQQREEEEEDEDEEELDEDEMFEQQPWTNVVAARGDGSTKKRASQPLSIRVNDGDVQ